MPNLPLSKYLDPQDLDRLKAELEIVDRSFTRAREQHNGRRWEYALALRARRDWLQWDYTTHGHANRAHGHLIKDVGGAGSPFRHMLEEDAGQPIGVIDPDQDPGMTLAQHLRWRGQLAHEVYCLSVLEHVEDLDQFLYHLSCLTAPGGLLFLTVDACHCPYHGADMEVGEPPDQHHFHWMRHRIFGRADLGRLDETLRQVYHFARLGAHDFTYRGDHVFDYTFAALAYQKRS